MNKELQEKLYKKYPKIFRDKDKSMQETCMCWGIECNAGWYDLLDKLCSLIQSHVDNVPYVCIDSKFKQWFKRQWNKYIWSKIIFPFSHIYGPGRNLKLIPKSYNSDDPNKEKYDKIWKNWTDFQNKWCLRSKYIEAPYDENRQVVAVQVKEKFGTLRFYTNGSDDYVYGLISMAEAMSGIICEECGGTKDVTHTSGWIKTICKECLNKNEE